MNKITRKLYIGDNSTLHYSDEHGTEIFVSENIGRFFVTAFSGRRQRPDWSRSYKLKSSINEPVNNYLKLLEDRRNQKSKPSAPQCKVGDIFYKTWGYDQTNVDFYEVVELKPKSVVVRKITSHVVEEYNSMSCMVAASPGQFIGKPILKRSDGGVIGLSKWNGKPINETSYA